MKIIEFFGTPRSGKTEQVQRLSKYLAEKEIKHKIITDREIEKEIEIPFEKAFEYNLTFFNKILEKIQEAQKESYKIVILDRGFIDGEVWFNVEHKKNNLSKTEMELALNYLDKLKNKYINFGIFMMVNPGTTFKRHKKKGELGKADDYAMNEDYIKDLYEEYLQLKIKLKSKNNIIILDGKESKETIELNIREKINSLLNF